MTFLFALAPDLVIPVQRRRPAPSEHLARSTPSRVPPWSSTFSKNPLWLLGWGALLGGFVFQALALHLGTLSQGAGTPRLGAGSRWRCASSWIRQRISWAVGVRRLDLEAGLVFVVLAEPQGTQYVTPTSSAWFSVLVTLGVLGGSPLAALSLRGSPTPSRSGTGRRHGGGRGLGLGGDSFIKAATDTLASTGVAGTFSRWPIPRRGRRRWHHRHPSGADGTPRGGSLWGVTTAHGVGGPVL